MWRRFESVYGRRLHKGTLSRRGSNVNAATASGYRRSTFGGPLGASGSARGHRLWGRTLIKQQKQRWGLAEAWPPSTKPTGSFVDDVERYLSLLGGENLLDENAPDQACKPSTINARRNYLRLAAPAAVKQGVPVESIRSLAERSLADLVSPPVVRLILEHYLAKKDGKIVTFTIDLANRLYAIARNYVKAPEEERRQLERFCLKLRPKRGRRRPGLTEKNAAVIRAFKDPQNRARLMALPRRHFDEALAEREALVQAAVKAEIALAIQFELVAPMRLANLAALHLEKNVIRVGGPEPTYHLVIPPDNVKNDLPLEYPLPKVVSEMLERYITEFRPRLCRSDNPWLFPGELDGYKTEGTLSGQIIKRIVKDLGIRVTPHQFRHLAAAFILEKDPANHEFVRRVLGHKNLQTTINFYVGARDGRGRAQVLGHGA
jgi:integrase